MNSSWISRKGTSARILCDRNTPQNFPGNNVLPCNGDEHRMCSDCIGDDDATIKHINTILFKKIIDIKVIL